MSRGAQAGGPAALSAAPLRVEPASLDDLETPAAVVDPRLVFANARRAAEYALAHGLAWRPHEEPQEPRGRSHPAREWRARPHRRHAARGRGHGRSDDDLLLAYPPVGRSKVARVLELPEPVDLLVGLDSAPALEGLAHAAAAAGRSVGVLVEVDVGMHRVGVQTPEDARALAARARELEACATAA